MGSAENHSGNTLESRCGSVSDRVVILFTRVPLPGHTKTRLELALTPEQCASVQSALAADIVRILARADCDLRVFYAPDYAQLPGAGERFAEFKSLLQAAYAGARHDLCFFPQKGPDLGARMNDAFQRAFALGARKCLLIGSDMVEFGVDEIEAAFSRCEGKRVVLAPSEDGGFWLVGLAQPFPELFAGKTYGVGTVYEEALRTCERQGRPVARGPFRRDVDTLADLRALAQRAAECPGAFPHLAQLLGQLGAL